MKKTVESQLCGRAENKKRDSNSQNDKKKQVSLRTMLTRAFINIAGKVENTGDQHFQGPFRSVVSKCFHFGIV